ncbi:MAG: RHS repeat domain-containing protein [Kiritimatiellia bacterium]
MLATVAQGLFSLRTQRSTRVRAEEQQSTAVACALRLSSETATVGGDTATLARTLDNRHRLAELRVEDAPPVQYGYDAENRHSAVSNTAFRATYAYTSDGWDAGYSVALTNGVVLARNLTRDPYRRSLVKAITNSASGVPYNPLAYTYDLLNRVTARNTDTFDYNARSEVTSAIIQPAHINRYAFDNIGNALWASLNSVTNIYTANELNQYFLISNHVNHVNPVQISPVYDLDGNMTWDGRFNYTYDAENRLVAAYSNGLCVVSNAYDHMSRRVLKVTPTATHTYLYDDWNLVQETISTASGTTTNHYVWGKDLSGSLQDAGGVGGLLAVSLNGAWYFPFYDNNGNITAYVDENGTIVAEYTYDAFGCTIEATGSMADAFRHRFSTKYYDAEIGLYYYGYRFYAPELMRWLNRDPIGEDGGVNFYGFVGNSPLSKVDPFGLAEQITGNVKASWYELDWWVGNALLGSLEAIVVPPGAQGNMIKGFTASDRHGLSKGNNVIKVKKCRAVFILVEVAPTSETTFPQAGKYEYYQDPDPFVYPIISSQSASLGRQRGAHSIIDRQASRTIPDIPYPHSALWIWRPTGSALEAWNVFLASGVDLRTVKPETYGLNAHHHFAYGELIPWDNVKKGINDYKLWVEMVDDTGDVLKVQSFYDLSATIGENDK